MIILHFDLLRQAVSLINGRFLTEASGGITEDNVLDYAHCGVDFISMGALTHSVKSLDMSQKGMPLLMLKSSKLISFGYNITKIVKLKHVRIYF